MIMYKASHSNNTISTIEAERATETSYWVGGRRNGRMGVYESVWESFDEAREHLKSRQESKISRAQSQIDSAKEEIKKLNLLQHI